MKAAIHFDSDSYMEQNNKRMHEATDPLYFVIEEKYYRNEIAAYRAEMNNGINVSSAYARERSYLYWKHQQDLKIAEQYYNK